MAEHICGAQGFQRGGPEARDDVCPACEEGGPTPEYLVAWLRNCSKGAGNNFYRRLGLVADHLETSLSKLRRIAELVPQVYSDAAPALKEIERLATGDSER